MGIFSGIRFVAGQMVNVRVHEWFGYSYIKESSSKLAGSIKSGLTPNQALRQENFDQAIERLQLSPQDINRRKQEFTKLFIIYLVLALGIFGYSLYIILVHKNHFGFFIGVALTLYMLSHAFRYHFWLFQIRHHKLGCSLREWFTHDDDKST